MHRGISGVESSSWLRRCDSPDSWRAFPTTGAIASLPVIGPRSVQNAGPVAVGHRLSRKFFLFIGIHLHRHRNVYIYTHTHIYIYIYTYIHIYIYIYMRLLPIMRCDPSCRSRGHPSPRPFSSHSKTDALDI